MDVFKAVEAYITKMVSEPSAMKVLLLDTHTVRGDVPPIPLRNDWLRGFCRHQSSPQRPLSQPCYHTKSI